MSWRQLLSIYQEAAEDAREEASRRPSECPNDGAQLEVGAGGDLQCPFDGWTWSPGGLNVAS